jgi:hypothetical protein
MNQREESLQKKANPKTMLTSIIDRDCASKFLAADRILSTPAAAAAISDVFFFFFFDSRWR